MSTVPIINFVIMCSDWSVRFQGKMRLFTHNFLQCHVKNCTSNNFPLVISEAEIKVRESEYNGDFMRNYLVKLDYPALMETVRAVGRSLVHDRTDSYSWNCKPTFQMSFQRSPARNCYRAFIIFSSRYKAPPSRPPSSCL